jgi:hypothetical protein
LPNITTVNAPRRRTTQRAHRHLDTGASRHDDGVLDMRDAVDDQSAGDQGGNTKMCWHGADSFRKTPPCHQRTSSKVSQSRSCTRDRGSELGSSLFGTLRSSVFRPLRCSAVNIFRGSALLFGISSVAPPAWDQKNEMAQSDARPDRAVARSIQEPKRTHLIHRPAKDIFPPRGRTHIRERFSSPC